MTHISSHHVVAAAPPRTLQERQTLALRAVCVLCVPLHPSQKKASPAALIVGASPLTLARDAQEAMFARCMRRSESGSPIKFHWPTRTSTLARCPEKAPL